MPETQDLVFLQFSNFKNILGDIRPLSIIIDNESRKQNYQKWFKIDCTEERKADVDSDFLKPDS